MIGNLLEIIALTCLVLLSLFSVLTIKFLKIEQFGSDSKAKQQAISRLTWNHYVFSSICLIIITRLFGFISNDLFIALFIAGLSALGIKITGEILKKL